MTFEALLFLGVLLAMILSEMPKKAVVAFVVLIMLSGIWMDNTGHDYLIASYPWLTEMRWFEYYIASITESIGAIAIMFASRYTKNESERRYFLLNGAFLWASAAVVVLFKYDLILYHVDYIYYSQLVALSHLLVMLILSDGIRNLARSVNDSFSSHRSRLFNLRG